MTHPRQTAQDYFDAWNNHDAAAVLATFAENGTYTDPVASTLSGPEIVEYIKGIWLSFPDLEFELVGVKPVSDELVAAQWIMRGTNDGPFQDLPPSGRSVELAGADFIQVENGEIRSVRGYFDSGEVPRQLGLQVNVQPNTVGPFEFGTSVAVRSGKYTRPGAFSITNLHVPSREDLERVREYSRKIGQELLEMPGFIGWTGMAIGDRALTVTAWESPEDARQLARRGTHSEAMKAFFGPDLALGGYTSVWTPERINAMWVRCPECSRMVDHEKHDGNCECGARLPDPQPYW